MMHWILQNNLFREEGWESMTIALDRFKIPYTLVKVVPFSGELIPEPEPIEGKVICFGSYSMRHAAKKYNWKPGVYDLYDVDFNAQKEHWGKYMLNTDSVVCAFKDAILSEPMFVRPANDSKHFSGKVFEVDEFNDWRFGICTLGHDYGNLLNPETLVQINKPVEIWSEYRYWIVDHKIVTKSRYKLGNRITQSAIVDDRFDWYVDQVLRTTNNLIDIRLNPIPSGWEPARAFCLDVCETPDGIKIVEINTINASGFYAGNIQNLVLALEFMEGR